MKHQLLYHPTQYAVSFKRPRHKGLKWLEIFTDNADLALTLARESTQALDWAKEGYLLYGVSREEFIHKSPRTVAFEALLALGRGIREFANAPTSRRAELKARLLKENEALHRLVNARAYQRYLVVHNRNQHTTKKIRAFGAEFWNRLEGGQYAT